MRINDDKKKNIDYKTIQTSEENEEKLARYIKKMKWIEWMKINTTKKTKIKTPNNLIL